MIKRYKFQCWNCPKVYFQSLEITDQQEIIVSCPYCKADAVVNLRPYRKNTISVMRHVDLYGENKENQFEDGLQLPDVLPAEKPEQQG